MRLFLYLAFLAFATSAFAQDAPTYQSQINTLADSLAQDIQRLSPSPHKGDPAPKVYLADFMSSGRHVTFLSLRLTDDLANALQSRLAPGAMLPRKQFEERMQSAGIAATDLQDLYSTVLQWQASQAGVTLLITGRATRANHITTLQLTLTGLPDTTARFTFSTELNPPPDLIKLAHVPVENWSPDPHAPISCPSGITTDLDTGHCISCKTIESTDAARKAKWKGQVVLKVAVDEQGHVTSAIVLAGAPYGMGEQAVDTIRQWKFRPATKGTQPIPVCLSMGFDFDNN